MLVLDDSHASSRFHESLNLRWLIARSGRDNSCGRFNRLNLGFWLVLVSSKCDSMTPREMSLRFQSRRKRRVTQPIASSDMRCEFILFDVRIFVVEVAPLHNLSPFHRSKQMCTRLFGFRHHGTLDALALTLMM